MATLTQNQYQAGYQLNPNPRVQPPVIQRKKNFLLTPLQKLQQWQQRIILFVLSIVAFFASLPLRIGLRILDLAERGIRYIVWLNIKSAVSWVNFVYRCLAFFRITKAVKIIDAIAKQHFRKYSAIDFDKEGDPSRFSLILRKKNYDLINIDKFEKRIKTPTFFIKRQVPKVQQSQQRNQPQISEIRPNVQQQSLVRQRIPANEAEDLNMSPKLVNISKSHQRIKKAQGEQNSSRIPGITVQIPSRTQNQGSQTRISPDRDISPERYMKPIPRIGEVKFSQDQNKIKLRPTVEGIEQHENQLQSSTNTYPILTQAEISKRSKQQLEGQLSNLRIKMEELIDDNNSYIQELEKWLTEKSQSISQTRKQNVELLQQMRQLQKENVQKTQKLSQIQQKIKQIQRQLHQERSQRAQVSSQLFALDDQIREKSVEIIMLKEKMNKKFKQIQQSQRKQRAYTGMKSEDESTLQNSMAQQDFEEQRFMEKLREEEEKTSQLADKVNKLLQDETRRLEQTKIEMVPQTQTGSKSVESSDKKKRKKSEPVVIQNDGKNKITMTVL